MAKRLTTNEIIQNFKNTHGSTYDYSLVDYKGDSKKVKIICKIHGEFEQQPGAHYRQKQGCPQCGNIKLGKSQQIGNKEFIKRIEKIFGKNKFNYSKLDYKGTHKDVILICKKCGNEEEKDPRTFYAGYGCLKCQIRRPNPKKITKEQFINRSQKIHDNKYNYSLVDFNTMYDEVEIICSKHGSFFQKPTVHLHAKSNCPECNITKGEEAISIWLNNNKIEYIFQHKIKIKNSNHYYDFYLPKHNIIIEYNGLQHYKPITFFGGQKGFEYLKKRDKIKENYCKENNIELLIISYKDDIEKILNEQKWN